MNHLLRSIATLIIVALAAWPAWSQQSLHPATDGPDWQDLFAADLSNALRPGDVWTFDDGVLTASEDEILWTGRVYDDFVLDLEFRNASGTNSGVFVYGSDLVNWVPYSVEIQIADDFHEEWASAPPTWQAGAVFGHSPARRSAVHPPGEWNRYTITCRGPIITVVLNGSLVNVIDMAQWTSAEVNPDGSEVPEWLSVPLADLPTNGHIGLQGMHGDAPIWFRNLRIREID